MRCEMKMSGAKGLGDPGAMRGAIISQLMYNATTVAIILNDEATWGDEYMCRKVKRREDGPGRTTQRRVLTSDQKPSS